MKDKGEIFAQYTVSRIDKALSEEPLTPSQRRVVLAALSTQDKSYKHPIDLRITLPLFFRSYYFTFFAGRDRRRGTLELQAIRYRLASTKIMRYGAVGTLAVLSFALALSLLYGIYIFKSAMGIDLFPSFHLSDIWIAMGEFVRNSGN